MVPQAGEALLREHVFVHLQRPADKLGALIAMTGKLYALSLGLIAEDNADALSSHEALLPGSLLAKFVADKLAEALSLFKRQARAPDLAARMHLSSLPPKVPSPGNCIWALATAQSPWIGAFICVQIPWDPSWFAGAH